MKLVEKTETFETNRQTRSFGFTIGDEGVILDILRKRLYSNPIQTLVQEYISNAMDANLSVGRSSFDLKITVPFGAHHWFEVRDFGPGLNEEEIERVFVRFGMSTKRDSAEAIGGFGIGGKSAWSYTDSFRLVSHCGGSTSTYLAHLGGSETGALTLVSRREQQEPNGLLIGVPVKMGDEPQFVSAVERMVCLWPSLPSLNCDYSLPKPLITVGDTRVFDSRSLPSPLRTRKVFLINSVPYVFGESDWSDLSLAVDLGTEGLPVSATRESILNDLATYTQAKDLVAKSSNEVREVIKARMEAHTQLRDLVKEIEGMGPLIRLTGDISTSKFPGLLFSRDKVKAVRPLKLVRARYPGDQAIPTKIFLSANLCYSLHRLKPADFRTPVWANSPETIVIGTATVKDRKLPVLEPIIKALNLSPLDDHLIPVVKKKPKTSLRNELHTVVARLSPSDAELLEVFRSSADLVGEEWGWIPPYVIGDYPDLPEFPEWLWETAWPLTREVLSVRKSLSVFGITRKVQEAFFCPQSITGREKLEDSILVLSGPAKDWSRLPFVPVSEPALIQLARAKPLLFLGNRYSRHYLEGYENMDNQEWLNQYLTSLFGKDYQWGA